MSLDESLLAYAIRNETGMTELQRMGVSQDDFVDDYRTVWRYLLRNKREFDAVPGVETVEQRFPDISLPNTRKREVPILVSDLKKRSRYIRFLTALNDAAAGVNSFDEVDEAVQALQGTLNTLTHEGNANSIVDLFSPEVRKRMLKEIRRRKTGKVVGIPTGIKSIDEIVGGLQKQKMVTVIGRPGLGKASACDEPVLTPTGWTPMGSIQVGDVVVTPDGDEAKVLQVHPQGTVPVYRVEMSDGSWTEVTSDHLWLTANKWERKVNRSSVRTTGEIAETLHLGHSIPVVEPYEWIDRNQDIDPYLLGKSASKFVPRNYLYASSRTRLEVLRGLMDARGNAYKDYCTFTPTSGQLANDVKFLVQSLGGIARKSPVIRGWLLTIKMPDNLCPFRMKRKAKRWEGQQFDPWRRIVSVTYVGDKPAQCITIDHPDHLYITRDFIVTHNSWLDLLFMATAVTNGQKVVLYPLEMTLFETATRLYTIFSKEMFGMSRVIKNMDLNRGMVSELKVRRFLKVMEEKFGGRLLVADMGTMSDPYTLERIEAETEVHRPDVIWIDYITLLKPPGNNNRGVDEWGAVKLLSGGIKGIAMRRNVVGGVSAQVNRQALNNEKIFLPRLENIAYGDSIGQDTDICISINRKGPILYYAVVKNRGGPEVPQKKCRFDVNLGHIVEEDDLEDED